jgi:hypothetical protein
MGENRMIRFSVSAFAVGMLCLMVGPIGAEDPKPGQDVKPATEAKTQPEVKTSSASPQTQKINELIAKGWESAGVKKPAEKASDFEFMRRAFIDLIGRIPSPEEIIDFEVDKSTNKRAKLIHRLLNEERYKCKDGSGKTVTNITGLITDKGEINYNDAYAENFAELWTTWMLTRTNTHADYRRQFHFWLTMCFLNNTTVNDVKYPSGVPWNKIVSTVIGATGKSNEKNEVVFVIRHLGEPIAAEMGQRPDLGKDGKFDAVPITSRITKLFLGIQSQCTQCHDHPFNKEYIQSDFWGVNAFFRQTERSGTTNPRNLAMGISPPPLTLSDVADWNNPGMVLYERRDGQRKASFPVMLKDVEQAQKGEMSSKRLVSGSIPSGLEGKTRRQILAQWVTEHDNFGKAFVNRVWGHLFGRGLNKEPTVDDFSSNNEVVHPELLDYLAEEFKKYNYDPKKLLEWICTSDVYQLSHVANKAYVDQKFDPFFARMPLKALSPEVMFESLSVATRAETRRKDKEAYKALKSAWALKLTQNFGDDEGNEINFNGTVVQALLMMNGKEINDEIGNVAGRNPKDLKDGGVVADVVKRYAASGPHAIYDELFLMTVSRHITSNEFAKLEQVRRGEAAVNIGAPPAKGPPGKGPAKVQPGGIVGVRGAAEYDIAYYQDVFWALLNSNEFMLNH